MISLKQGGTLLLLALFSSPLHAQAAPAQFEIDLKELDRQKPPASPKPEKKKAQKTKKAPAPAISTGKARQDAADNPDYLRYTVRPGDHIFKILIARFGMSSEAAERLIPEIIRINDISNIKHLQVGRTLLIPRSGQQERVAGAAKKRKTRHGREAAEPAAVSEISKVEKKGAADSPDAKSQGAQVAPPVGKEPQIPLSPPLTKGEAESPLSKGAREEVKSPPLKGAKEEVKSQPSKGAKEDVKSPPLQRGVRGDLTLHAPAHAAPAPAQPTPAPAPAQPAPARARVSAPAPVPTAPAPVASAPAPPAVPSVDAKSPVIPVAPAGEPPITWICSVTEQEPSKIVDAALNALSISWSRNRIIQSDKTAATAFSIRVDRYFEYRGARYIVSIDESDPYSYTLLRLLEGAGYRVLRVGAKEDFKAVTERLLGLLGLVPDFGRHALQGGRETTGFLIQQEEAGGRRLVLSGERVKEPRAGWVMAPGCVTR